MVEERGLAATVSARSFHGWCNDQLKLYHLRRPEGTGKEFIEKLVQTVIQGVDSGQVPRAQYGAVLVDEGHDFEPEWLKLVAQMVHPETNSLLVLYDDAQSINRRKARLGFSFAEVGIQARGRTTILRMNYRNTAQIMAVACEFGEKQGQTTISKGGNSGLSLGGGGRHPARRAAERGLDKTWAPD